MSEYTENKVNRSPKKKVGRQKKKNRAIPRTIDRSFKILDIIKEKPLSVNEIASKLAIDHRRVNEIVNDLIFLEKVKKISNKVADINYDSLEEKIEKEIGKKLKFNENRFPNGKRHGQIMRKELFRTIDKEFMVEVADNLGELYENNFIESFIKVCKKKGLRIRNLNKQI
ncbi:MAG: hypothetical protein ACOCUU_03000 [Nanoarchaeota archaeon]